MGELDKRTWAEVSLENIRHNYAAIRAAILDESTKRKPNTP